MNMELESKPSLIRLRFVRHPGIFSTLVQYAQFGFRQTHAEAFLPEGGVIGAWFEGGTRVRPVGYDGNKFTDELLINIKATPEQEDAFYTFLRENLLRKYDALAIVAFAAGRDWQEPDSWFCSEYIAAGLVAAGLFPSIMAARLNKVTVKDLALVCAGLDHA